MEDRSDSWIGSPVIPSQWTPFWYNFLSLWTFKTGLFLDILTKNIYENIAVVKDVLLHSLMGRLIAFFDFKTTKIYSRL